MLSRIYFPAIAAVIGLLCGGESLSQTLPAAKQAIANQYAQERATGAQNPAPKNPQASYPVVAEVSFPTGIVNGGDAPFSSEAVTVINYWQGLVNGARTFLYAGAQAAQGTDPTQGLIILETQPDYPKQVTDQTFLTPIKAGPVKIVATQNNTFLLVSSTGSYVFTFNLGSQTFTSYTQQPATQLLPAQVSITTSGLAYSRATQTFSGTISVQNIGTTSINAPINIVLNSLTTGVTLVNPVGTFSSSPFTTLPLVTSLAPGQTATISVHFENPSNGSITFTPAAYSGSF